MTNDRDNLLAAHALDAFDSPAERARAQRLLAEDPQAAADLRAIESALAEAAAWEPRIPNRRLEAQPIPAVRTARRLPMMRWTDLVKAAALIAVGFGMGLLARALDPQPAAQLATTQTPSIESTGAISPPLPIVSASFKSSSSDKSESSDKSDASNKSESSSKISPPAYAQASSTLTNSASNPNQPDVFSGSALALMGYAIGTRMDFSESLEKPKEWIGNLKAPRQIWDSLQAPPAPAEDEPASVDPAATDGAAI